MSNAFNLPVILNIPDLPKYLKQVESRMDNVLGAGQSQLNTAVLRLTKAHGKRLRPTLVIAAALLGSSGIDDSVIAAAGAVELIHIGSLVHDDIIDEAHQRWGIDTINAKEGLDTAILAGDYIFSKACQLAAEANQQVGIIAAQTIAALSEGQAAEIAFCYDVSRTKADLEKAIYGKTAALLSAACRMGGICSGHNDDQQTALSYFGEDFGTSFQLIDDVLDFVSSAVQLGKPVGNDVKEGVYTLPVILGLGGSQRMAIITELDKKTVATSKLIQTLLDGGCIEKTISKAYSYSHSAQNGLLTEYGESAEELAALPARYIDWALGSLVAPKYQADIMRSA